MNREEIKSEIYRVFREQFEIEDPGLHDDLRTMHGFDSIDAIELLVELEKMFHISLDQELKKDAVVKIRTIDQICDYVEQLVYSQGNPNPGIASK
ncbi:MAG: acyl carrier protein [Desulfohalobiaceae bacterium]